MTIASSKNSPVLVIGADGQVGRALVEGLRLENQPYVALTRADLDLSQPGFHEAQLDAVLATRALNQTRDSSETRESQGLGGAPGAVFLAAAYTQVDRAESEPEVASRVNSLAPATIARWCAARGIPLVHYSTDYVFHGLGSKPHREEDLAKPVNLYGATKLAGETAIAAAKGPYLIFRTSWVYSERGPSFLQTMLRLGRAEERLAIVNDQVGAPTCAWDLARASREGLAAALGAPVFPSGVYHLCASGETSWNGFAREIFRQARKAGVPLRVTEDAVDEITTVEYARRQPSTAPRPLNSRLQTEKARAVLGLSMADWREALEACFSRMPPASEPMGTASTIESSAARPGGAGQEPPR